MSDLEPAIWILHNLKDRYEDIVARMLENSLRDCMHLLNFLEYQIQCFATPESEAYEFCIKAFREQ